MAVSKRGGKDLTFGNPYKLIVNFALPIILGNLFQQFYNLVDTMIVGRFLGVDALAGVGATGSLNFLVLGFCCGIGAGFVIPVANRFGAGDYGELKKYFGNSILLSAAIAAVLTTGVALTTRQILVLLNTPDNVIDYSYEYILIIFLGIPITLAYNLLAGAVRSIGDSKTPLYVLLIASVINLGLDYTFIVPIKLGVRGAALATVASQVLSIVMLVVVIRQRFEVLHISRSDLIPDGRHIKQLLLMGFPMGLQYSITAIGSVILTASVNILGAVAIASMTAATKVSIFFSCPLDSLGSAMATYAGQNLGAGKIDRINKGFKAGALLGTGYSVFALAVLYFFGASAVGLFVTNPSSELVSQAREYLLVNAAFYITLMFVNLVRFMIQGLGHAPLAILAGLMEMVARAIAGLVLVPLLGFTGACLASPLAWVLADAFLLPAYFGIMKKIKMKFTASAV